ncbi:hypothetical protein ACOSQ2_014091 [Xanthoceras sorbifolium]
MGVECGLLTNVQERKSEKGGVWVGTGLLGRFFLFANISNRSSDTSMNNGTMRKNISGQSRKAVTVAGFRVMNF